jgi:hypothetical protein
MKRNPRSFSVEIKKFRTPGQHHQLPSKRLVGTLPAEIFKAFQKQELEATAEPGTIRRILPSIIKSMSSSPELVEPVRRKRPSRGKVSQAQIEFALSDATSETEKDQPAETLPISEAVSHTAFTPVVEENRASSREAQPGETATGRARKPRSKSPEVNAQAIASRSIMEPKHAPESEMIEAASVVSSRTTGQSRLTKCQVVAAQLLRHQRWKWRLSPAAW